MTGDSGALRTPVEVLHTFGHFGSCSRVPVEDCEFHADAVDYLGALADAGYSIVGPETRVVPSSANAAEVKR